MGGRRSFSPKGVAIGALAAATVAGWAFATLAPARAQGQTFPFAPAASTEPAQASRASGRSFRSNGCSDDMVAVGGRVCVDRYESSFVDTATGATFSPYYPPHPRMVRAVLDFALLETNPAAATEADDAPLLALLLPFPSVPDWEREGEPRARAIARAGVVPQGYVNQYVAAAACAAAGKRLCTEDEWRTACRGENDTQFPYGATFRANGCNVAREAHPAQMLYGNASFGHLDPRLNQLASSQGVLLRPTGRTPTCASRWGDDAIYDMVGNLDEWVDNPDGEFVGGFYSRGTRNGCDAKVTVHPPRYFDYSLGVRCCDDVRGAAR